MKKLNFYLFLITVLITNTVLGADTWFPEGIQVKTGSTFGAKATADTKAIVDMRSTTKGMLPPRMTTAQRVAISSPTEGLIVFDTDINSLYQYTGSAWLQVATVTGTETLTNKTIDADGTGNSITNIENADIKAAAAIAVNKLAATTASRALVSDGSGFISPATTTATEIGYVNGLTSSAQNQINTKQTRSTLTTKGDLYVATASDTVARQGVGSDGQVLTADSSTTNGVKWATSASAPTSSEDIKNITLTATVAANALTIAMKDSSGSDCSGGSPCVIGFRNATPATGTYTSVSVTGALSVVVSSGSTLGHVSGVNRYIYVYAINNAGTAELAVSSKFYSAGSVVTTVAEGGAGGADVNATIYSTTARSNVPIRLIGRLLSSQATAGTWATAIAEVSVGQLFNYLEQSELRYDTHAGYGSTGTKVPYYTNNQVSTGTAMTASNGSTNGLTVTINEPGIYAISMSMRQATNGEDYVGISLNASSGATAINSLAVGQRLCVNGGVPVSGNSNYIGCSWTGYLGSSDVIRPHTTTATVPGTLAQSSFQIVKLNQN